ncbi:hypothetical protein TWF730_005010 [Orbilia blumenaviensis]|uniref:Uncharacterized protein n=1 Tax=Orbilia blumenaviensis TaxID=1796055 RepID=A0AAV9VIE5_9PEZI
MSTYGTTPPNHISELAIVTRNGSYLFKTRDYAGIGEKSVLGLLADAYGLWYLPMYYLYDITISVGKVTVIGEAPGTPKRTKIEITSSEKSVHLTSAAQGQLVSWPSIDMLQRLYPQCFQVQTADERHVFIITSSIKKCISDARWLGSIVIRYIYGEGSMVDKILEIIATDITIF